MIPKSVFCEAHLLTGEACYSLWSTIEWFSGIRTQTVGLHLCEDHVDPVLRVANYFENGRPKEVVWG